MDEDIHEYDAAEITVSYDANRCIHVRECVRGLPDVFDPDEKPWIDPENATPDELAEVIRRCPTGALHYERSDGGPAEPIPEENVVTVAADGPLYVRGDVELTSPGGDVLLEDTRVALCRCGASENKPLCDNSHRAVSFEAEGSVTDDDSAAQDAAAPDDAAAPGEDAAAPDDGADGTTPDGENADETAATGEVRVTPTSDGPFHVEGPVEITGQDDGSSVRETDAWLCRCGHSGDKPYCDGTHADVGFSDDE